MPLLPDGPISADRTCRSCKGSGVDRTTDLLCDECGGSGLRAPYAEPRPARRIAEAIGGGLLIFAPMWLTWAAGVWA